MQTSTQRVPTRRQHILGVILILLVASIWVFSAEFIQFIFGSSNFSKPYFLTYVSTSAFSIFLLGFLRPSWRASLHQPPQPVDQHAYEPLHNSAHPNTSTTTATAIAPGDDPVVPVRFPPAYVLSVGASLAAPFFIANWTNNTGLQMTSVASSSTIATLTSLFTLIIGAITGVERFSFVKLISSFLSIAGVALIMSFDKTVRQPHAKPVLGDAFSILSAIVYAAYTIFLKARAGPEGTLNMSMMLGFMGIVTALGAWPGLIAMDLLKWESFSVPEPKTALMLFANAMIGTVLSDYLWATSVVLTSPLVTSLSLSLTTPLSIFADAVFRHKHFNWSYILGAILVLMGFFLVNLEMSLRRQEATATEEHAEQKEDMEAVSTTDKS